jgi:hypothetical protein
MAVLSIGKGGGSGTGTTSYDFTEGGWRVADGRPSVIHGGSPPIPLPLPLDIYAAREIDDLTIIGGINRVIHAPLEDIEVDPASFGDDMAVRAELLGSYTATRAWTPNAETLEEDAMADVLPSFDGSYCSYVYKVTFSCDVEAALPKPSLGATAMNPGGEYQVYMRVHIPVFWANADIEWLGVVLFMEGGIDAHGAVRREEKLEDENSRLLRSYLAAGFDYPANVVDPLEDSVPYYFRPGNKMVVATFNYPGRGTDFPLDGALDFVHDSPTNMYGQDYAGEQTLFATEAVARVLLTIVDDLRERWNDQLVAQTFGGTLGSEGYRFVVCTSSWGLNPAARWIYATNIHVHALIDWEGPTDSAEALIVTDFYDPYGLDDEISETELTLDVFQDWAVQNYTSFPHWFRPPNPMLFSDDEWPVDWDEFVARLADGYDSSSQDPRNWWERDAANIAAMWDWRFNGQYSGTSCEEQLGEFWEPREAITWLRSITNEKGTAYIRIQGKIDHNQPEHMRNRHAAKALAAAYDGDQDLAFFADPTYWECVNDDRDAAAEPRQMDRVFDLENPDATDPDCWFYPDFWPEINVGKVWCVQLDLVRWAVETDFGGSRSTRTASSSHGWTLR